MLPWTFNQFARDLSQFDEPNTIYAFMQSIVNYDNDEPVKIKDLSKYARTTIFDFDYPISEEFGKEEFETMFLNHYMFRRINYDTLTSFKIHLQVKLNDIMPKYNKMVEGFNKIAFDGTVETHERTFESVSNGESNVASTSSDTSESDTKYSDTPEGRLDDVKSGKYLSEYTLNGAKSNGASTSNSTNKNNSNDTENILIKRGDPIDEYTKYLEIVNNIYSLIFKECDVLFYGLV